jgi:4-alpha-glucanotransferase
MSEQTEASLLSQLAEQVGIAVDYHDIAGTRHVTSDETKRAILTAMGFRVDSEEALSTSLREWEERGWRQPCEPVLVIREGQSGAKLVCCLDLDDGKEGTAQLHWDLHDEGGAAVQKGEVGPGLVPGEVRFLDGRRHVRIDLPVPEDLPIGYYDMTIRGDGLIGRGFATTRLIVAPRHCYVPLIFQGNFRLWGLALQLYSLSSDRNWGCGDFTDLGKIVSWAGETLGAGVIGLNPLHALRNRAPHHVSPYSPLSRLYLNDLYIDLERLPEFWGSDDAQRQYRSPEFQTKLKAWRENRQVGYDGISAAKRSMLDLAYRQFLKEAYTGEEPDLKPHTPRGCLLERFIQSEGEPLELFAIFQAIEEERQMLQPQSSAWPDWPKQLLSPGVAVREYGRRHRKRVRFYQYVQWVAAEQLSELKRLTGRIPMPIGLYHDLALGVAGTGADAWIYQQVLALAVDCGAPPDPLGPEGQNWGLPPVDPHRLRANRYDMFIRLLRNNLRFGGAIRLDHVMSLFRLFWIPQGQPASTGTYVHYPFEDLLAITALESVRAKAVVIGEDLGTVPDWVRDQLNHAKILSYRVFYFERTRDGSWKTPDEYPAQALAVVGTHDLPTATGYWSGEDLRVRAGLGGFADEAARRKAWDEREREKGMILGVLKREGLLPDGVTEDVASVPEMTPALCRAIHVYLARTPSWIVIANLEDGLGELSQTNVPGTVESHPNWSRKYSLQVDELIRDEQLCQLADALRSVRPLM